MWIKNDTKNKKIVKEDCFLNWIKYNKHMEQELIKKIEAQQLKIDEIYESVEKTRKYFLWTMIITIALFILPLIGMIFVIPSFISQYSQIQDLGL